MNHLPCVGVCGSLCFRKLTSGFTERRLQTEGGGRVPRTHRETKEAVIKGGGTQSWSERRRGESWKIRRQNGRGGSRQTTKSHEILRETEGEETEGGSDRPPAHSAHTSETH